MALKYRTNDLGHIDNWKTLTRLIEKYQQTGFLFRGQSSAKHERLIPKVGRVDKASGSARKFPYDPDDELQAFAEFKKAARPYVAPTPATEIEWLAVAQHHGLQTRLLDWTESLLVAAYFAVELTQTTGAIFCVSNIREIGLDEENSVFKQTGVLMYHPPHISPRIAAQHSVFTVHPKPSAPFTHLDLGRWIVDREACWPIKRALAAAGITPAVLFPGIDGLSQYLAWRYKWAYFRELNARRHP